MKIKLSIEVLFVCIVILDIISGAATDQDQHRTLRNQKDYNKLGWGDGNKERTEEEADQDSKKDKSYADRNGSESDIEEDEEEPIEIDLVDELQNVEDWFTQEA